MQRNWKPPASGRTSEESVPVGPPTQLNRNQLLAETLHIARPIAHCILYKQLHNKAFQSNPAVRLPIGPWGFFWGGGGSSPCGAGRLGCGPCDRSYGDRETSVTEKDTNYYNIRFVLLLANSVITSKNLWQQYWRFCYNKHPLTMHRIVHNSTLKVKISLFVNSIFFNINSVLSLYKFGLDSWKPWLVSSGMDIARWVENVCTKSVSLWGFFFVSLVTSAVMIHTGPRWHRIRLVSACLQWVFFLRKELF